MQYVEQLLKNGYDFHISRDENSHGQNISNYFDIDMGLMRITNNTFQKTIEQKNIIPKYSIYPIIHIWGFYQTDKYISDNNEMVKKV
jgi:hypothetical protein